MLKTSSRPHQLAYRNIIFVGQERDELLESLENASIECQFYQDPFLAHVNCLSKIYAGQEPPYAVICREDLPNQEAYSFIKDLQKCPQMKRVPCILYNPSAYNSDIRAAKEAGADDLYTGEFGLKDLLDRLEFLQQTKILNLEQEVKASESPNLQVTTAKRVFDILVSFLILLIISPLLLVIALIIKLESTGPVFYISKRVGTGYRIFNFYKFRTMRADADKMMEKLIHLNQYTSEDGTTFVKIDNDPRITPFGRFLRNTSLDELPQLFNVLLGDMSIVGNRPLPLYEAEKITKDLWSKRFLAPAGITGLWQVTKRGRKEMSAEERIALDMTYADHCSLWYDLKIMALTLPALLQKESV